MHSIRNHLTVVAAALLSLILTGCGEEQVAAPETPRPIAWTRVVAAELDQVRRISGTLQAAENAQLSFEVSGKVKRVTVKLGDAVKKGQVLAELDESSYQLNRSASQGDLQKAKASLADAENEFKRQKTLYDKGWVAKAAYDTALAGLETAQSAVKVARARLDLSRKDLADTALRAPYDGKITARLIEPSQRINAGVSCFEIEGKQGLEIAVMAPETLVGYLRKDHPFDATFPAMPGLSVKATITEIGSQAEQANAFPVTLLLAEQPKALRSGMSAEVDFTFEGRGRTGYQGAVVKVPPTALMAGEQQKVYVFVYDEAGSTLHKRAVQTENVINNEVLISSGLKPGEIIATAGVVYLHHGQKVALLGVGPKRFN
uniref:Putative efflux transporter, MFP subunit, AcrA/E family n=1 Tax=Magnetococcus massalia (strain MO-1) TaxID=451514 RepID=A0A1S7LEN5_MAGMO|nr:putative efflux transporter, MFP subunit, AcrA/E family [Candidatus Magnetococcus massalia]